MAVDVGDNAPDFTLKDQNNQDVNLSSFEGQKNVLIVFYPLTFTGVCQGELCAIRDDLARYQNDKVQVLAISVDSPFAHKVWAEQQGYDFPLLADFWPHGAVAESYGVFNSERGIALRGSFLVDTAGKIVWKTQSEGIPVARDQADYEKALATL